jgi:hypothetical protein
MRRHCAYDPQTMMEQRGIRLPIAAGIGTVEGRHGRTLFHRLASHGGRAPRMLRKSCQTHRRTGVSEAMDRNANQEET